MAKSDYAVKQFLTKKGYEVYNEVLNKLQDGSDKSKLAANENAFIYARMAESWARIRNEYGDTAYTAKDFMAEHAVNMGYKEFNQLVTPEEKLERDERNFSEAVDKFMKDELKEKTVNVMTTPLVMKLVGAEILPIRISARELHKALKGKHSDELESDHMKQLPRALTDPLMIFDTYNGKSGNPRRVIVVDLKGKTGTNIIVPLELSTQTKKTSGAANIMVSSYEPTYRLEKKGDPKKPKYKYFFNEIDKGKLLYANKNKVRQWLKSEAVQSAIPDKTVVDLIFKDSIPDENDLVKLKKENWDLYQTDKEDKETYYQRAWHGSGMDFNEFNLEKALTGAGDMVHGWGIYTAKNKKTARAYKKHAKSKGLPSYQYEVDIPFIDARPCV